MVPLHQRGDERCPNGHRVANHWSQLVPIQVDSESTHQKHDNPLIQKKPALTTAKLQRKAVIEHTTTKNQLTRSCRFCQRLRGRSRGCWGGLSSSGAEYSTSASSCASGSPGGNHQHHKEDFKLKEAIASLKVSTLEGNTRDNPPSRFEKKK